MEVEMIEDRKDLRGPAPFGHIFDEFLATRPIVNMTIRIDNLHKNTSLKYIASNLHENRRSRIPERPQRLRELKPSRCDHFFKTSFL